MCFVNAASVADVLAFYSEIRALAIIIVRVGAVAIIVVQAHMLEKMIDTCLQPYYLVFAFLASRRRFCQFGLSYLIG